MRTRGQWLAGMTLLCVSGWAMAQTAPAPGAAARPSAAPSSANIRQALSQGQGVSGIIDATGWKITNLTGGYGPPVDTGAWVRFKFVGWLYDPKAPDGKGAQFDSSEQRGEPFVFQLGRQSVIMGWDSGVLGMRSGGKRRLLVPPQMAFGDKGYTTKDGKRLVEPNATLVFEIELIDFLPPYKQP